MPQLADAAQRTLGLRNLTEADSIIDNLLHTISSDAIRDVWCHLETGDEYTVTLRNHTTDEDGKPTSEEPSDPSEFHKAAKALQDLILSEPQIIKPVIGVPDNAV
ncbi:MAG: hypothetical protein LAO30_19595 [Acidobacteriia bacterium]|nr:hypothetical protein [Terriglobia bacterium]